MRVCSAELLDDEYIRLVTYLAEKYDFKQCFFELILMLL